MSNNNNQQIIYASRRQTLGGLSPGQVNARGGAAASRVTTVTGKDGGGAGGNAKLRKSMAPGIAGGFGMNGGMQSLHASFSANPHSSSQPSQSEQQQLQQLQFQQQQRNSSIGIDRRSSAHAGKAAGGAKTDPRPLNSKGYQEACAKTIIEYLSAHGYKYTVTPKTIANITTNDYKNIVHFLISRFDPKMPELGKIEDDVPLFYKRLEYPFTITKSALYAVGNSNSWPGVLAALQWLVELLNYNERVGTRAGSSGSSNFDADSKAKVAFFEYICSSYRHFLAGDDVGCAAADDAFVAQFTVKEEEAARSMQSFSQTFNATVAQLEAMRTAPSPLEAAVAKRRAVDMDAGKLADLISKTQALKEKALRDNCERAAALQSRQEAIITTRQDIEVLRQRVSSQPVNKADLQKMNLERNKRREDLARQRQLSDELEAQARDKEMHILNELQTLEASMEAYNGLAHRLQLIPASAKRAGGTTYELRINRDANSPAELTNLDFKSVVRPGLERLCEVYHTKAKHLAQDLVSLKEQAASGAEQIQERKEEVAALELQLSKLEARLMSSKEAQEERLRALGGRAEALHSEADHLRSSASSRQAHVDEARRAALLEYEAAQRTCEAQLARAGADLRTALSMMVEHRQAVQARIASTLSAVRMVHAEVASLQQPVL